MFNFKNKNKKDIPKNTTDENLYQNFNEELNKFKEYDSLSEILFDECFMFMYRNIKNMRDTLIVASVLRQIEVPIEEIKKIYLIDDEYIENIISNLIPSLRVKAYKRLKEELPNQTVAFFPGFHYNFEPLYVELIDRIEYFFEVRRNQQKIKKELANNEITHKFLNNASLLVLLNYFSLKEALIVSSNLNLLDIDEDEIQKIYPFNEDYFKQLLYSSNITYITDLLNKRIEKLRSIEMETSFFDYHGLSEQYDDLLNRIDDTKQYFSRMEKR